MLVFVVSQDGTPLMPTTPRRARLWLAAKRARVVRREPFTIQLRFQTQTYLQPVTVGVDTGSKTVGIAAHTNGEVVYQAEVHLRDDISKKMTQRRLYRRSRRNRKTRYRKARWANRGRPAGWLPPLVRAKADATIKAVWWLACLLPVSKLHVEIGSFDTQQMQHPEIAGISYQQGELYGYLLREYVLAKWCRTCVYCGATGIPLQLEHIVPKARGGSDRATNLTLACGPCNRKKGTQTAAEFGFPQVQAQAKIPLKDAAHVSSLKTRVVEQLQLLFGGERVHTRFGYQTKYQRIQVLGWPKSHANDAVAIACELGEVVKPLSVGYQCRCLPRDSYQLFNGKHSEHNVSAPKRVYGWKLYELVEAKGHVGYIGGRRRKGAFLIKDVESGKTLLEVVPRKLRRLAHPWQGWLIQRKEERASSPA